MSVPLPVTVRPFQKYSWHGQALTFDDTPTHDFTPEDVEEVWKYFDDGDRWDGTCGVVFRLTDGRWVAYETFWGPTGDGFCDDAYGGDANIYFAKTKEDAARYGLTPEGRARCGIVLEGK